MIVAGFINLFKLKDEGVHDVDQEFEDEPDQSECADLFDPSR
jgi:hypothetical protein